MLLIFLLLFTAVSRAETYVPFFYSYAGSEHQVSFSHSVETEMTSLDQLRKMSFASRDKYIEDKIRPLLKFLYGPLTHRGLGNPQRDDIVEVEWQNARMHGGKVYLPLKYSASWILTRAVGAWGQFVLPVPRSVSRLYSPSWKRCTDSDPEHATEYFYWYFWDPKRPGCDHREGEEYDEVTVSIGFKTAAETSSYPEYDRMFRYDNADGQREWRATMAFGYVEDPAQPKPESDSDQGAYEYRRFLAWMKRNFPDFKSEPLYLSDYYRGEGYGMVIGHRFYGMRDATRVSIKVVMAAGVDQMYLFAKSFAHDHDSAFAWLGHSRVGSGFDATNFQNIVKREPEYYSISKEYQLVYWGGCNSYSYYTLPFFEIKSAVDPKNDPFGTKNLDIVAHGLPSYFSLNAINAAAFLTSAMSWRQPTSYQSLIRKLEEQGAAAGARLLAVVLGDEDNGSNP